MHANGETGTAYKIEQAVIYLIWDVEQAEISEIGLNQAGRRLHRQRRRLQPLFCRP
jgi:hypothetical protein